MSHGPKVIFGPGSAFYSKRGFEAAGPTDLHGHTLTAMVRQANQTIDSVRLGGAATPSSWEGLADLLSAQRIDVATEQLRRLP